MAPLKLLKATVKGLISVFWRRKQTKRTLISDPSASILKLPVDILECIVDRLSPSDAAALALSSKTMLDIVGLQTLRIKNKKDRIELLKHFEINFPDHVLCYQCGKFHRRQSRMTKNNTECDNKNGKFISSAAGATCISFVRAQEIMNRHRYGKKHGLPLSFLDENSSSWIELGHWSRFDIISEKTRAKIIDNELLVRVEMVYISRSNKRALSSKNFKIQYCPHHASWTTIHPNQLDLTRQNFIRCLECSTEIRFECRNTSLATGKVRATVWYNMGQCRTPFDDKWRALTEKHKDDYHGSKLVISREEANYHRLRW